MERKIIGCEHSADARELIGEVDGYITFTKGDQEARVQKVCVTVCVCVLCVPQLYPYCWFLVAGDYGEGPEQHPSSRAGTAGGQQHQGVLLPV